METERTDREEYEFSAGKIQGDLVAGLNQLGAQGWQFCALLQPNGASIAAEFVVLLQRRKHLIRLARVS